MADKVRDTMKGKLPKNFCFGCGGHHPGGDNGWGYHHSGGNEKDTGRQKRIIRTTRAQ